MNKNKDDFYIKVFIRTLKDNDLWNEYSRKALSISLISLEKHDNKKDVLFSHFITSLMSVNMSFANFYFRNSENFFKARYIYGYLLKTNKI